LISLVLVHLTLQQKNELFNSNLNTNDNQISKNRQSLISQTPMHHDHQGDSKQKRLKKELHKAEIANAHPKNLLKMSANVNGLRSKLDVLSVLTEAKRPSFLTIQETKISNKIDSNTLSLPGYMLYRKDRNENGGGVAIYANENLKIQPVKTGIESDLEIVAVRCKLKKSSYIVATMYKPPSFPISTFVEKLSNFITSLGDEKGRLILTGDTNICVLKQESASLKDMCDRLKLNQLIIIPTHKDRAIDHIYVSNHLIIDSFGLEHQLKNITLFSS
jgi:exonuclease III